MNSFFIDNPILLRELRGRMRSGIRNRLPILILLPVIIYFYTRSLLGIASGPAANARDTFRLLSFLYLTLIVVLAPALAATSISQERELQTWDAIKASLLTPGQILAGKWIGRQVPVAFGTVVLLPFLLANSVRGGVGAGGCLQMLGFVLLTAQTLVGFGLLCSMQFRRTQTAIAISLMSTAAACIGTFLSWGILQTLMGVRSAADAAVPAGMAFNPFYALYMMMSLTPPHDLNDGTDPAFAWGIVTANIVLQAGALALILIWLARGLRGTSRE